eukprot:snap_masked-scaffold_3-processed-gene-17.9-mRNA-1 protein AED:0.34 eAED:0.34 QI:0/0/0/0.5/1/1/2/0/283
MGYTLLLSLFVLGKTRRKMDDRLNEENWAEISQHVSEIRANTIAKNSQSSYEGSCTQFLAWCARNKHKVLAEDFLNKLNEGSDAEAPISLKLIRKTVKNFPNLPPLKFDELDVEIFMSWIVTKKRSDVSFLSYSSYSTHRSALYSLYRQDKARFSSEFKNELKNHFRGLKRKIASEEQAGKGVIKRRKYPLDPTQVQSVHQLCEFISCLERSIYIQFSALLVMSQNMIVISFNCNLLSAHFILSINFFFHFRLNSSFQSSTNEIALFGTGNRMTACHANSDHK